jgi:chemotaxis protein histidine kinase CheA
MAPTNSDMDEIWAILAQEGRENLSIIEDALLKLEKRPDNRDDIAALFRALHTFKGTVRMMDFSITEGLAHHAEDLVALVRDEGVTLDEEMIDLLLVAMDRMRSLLEHILTYHTDVEAAEVTVISNKLAEMVRNKKDLKEGTGEPFKEGSHPAAIPVETVVLDEPATIFEAIQPDTEMDLPGDGGLLLSDEEIESVQEAIIFEPVNLADDPEYVQIFLDVTLPELDRLHGALDEIQRNIHAELQPELLRRVVEPLETLQIASERMGYQQINSLLESIIQIANPSQVCLDQAEINQLIKFESQLFEEFAKLKSCSRPTLKAETEDNKLENAYHQWYTRRLKTDLDQMDVIINKFNLDDQFKAVLETEHQKALTEELNRVLGSLYHICIDDHLEQAAQLTLTLEDLGIRINQGEIPVTSSFIDLLQTYSSQLHEVFENPDADKNILSMTFDAMIGLSQEMIKLTVRNPILQVTRNFINHLDIDPQFKKILTNENLAEISQSIRAGFNLYTLLANVENNEEIGVMFQKWVSSGSIIPITNITDRSGSQCVLNFLVAASYDINTIRNSLKQMDPEEKYFSISQCAILPNFSSEKQMGNGYENDAVQKAAIESTSDPVGNLPIEVIGELTEMVGGLVADQSTLSRVIARMAEKNTTESIMRLLRSSLNGNNLGNDIWINLNRELQTYWVPWEMDISSLVQTDVKLSAGLVQLQEKTRSLGLRPATELLNPLPKIAQSFAFRQGKQVSVKCWGGDSELDQRTLSMLAETVHNLIAFCINESLELPDERAKNEKNTTGQIRVSVIRTENHTQVVIEDDGNGLNQARILARGNELGWATPDELETSLTAWLFNPEFYLLGGSDINLAALNQVLQSNKGKLTLFNKPGHGLQFKVNLQLDVAVVDGMVVRVGDIRYILPVYAIQRIIQPNEENLINTAADGGGQLLNMEGKVYPIRNLRSQKEKGLKNGNQQQPHLLVIIDKEPQSVALDVDELIGRQSVLVRPLSGDLMNNRNTIGCALLGEGEIGMVLDLDLL